jgi:hypothetical protein
MLLVVIDQWTVAVGLINTLISGVAKLRSYVGSDFEEVEEQVEALSARVGRPVADFGLEDCASVWDGLLYMGSRVQTVVETIEAAEEKERTWKEDVTSKCEMLQSQSSNFRVRTEWVMQDMIKKFGELTNVVNVLNQEQERLTDRIISLGTHDNTIIVGKLSELETLKHDFATLFTSLMDGLAKTRSGEIERMKVQLKLLEARIPSALAGQIGRENFQSRADVELFTKNYVPTNAFILFHDVMTLLESLSAAHVERRDFLQEWYQSSKVGVSEAHARHMASFCLVLPTVFVRTKEGAPITSKHQLPAVKSFKEWNTFDGVSGVKGFITAGMEDLKYQLRQDIEQRFVEESQVKAKILALEMHELSQSFVMEICSWLDSFYQELVITSEAAEEEAWEVVGACIKKMFKEIRVPHAQAANATMETNPTSQCTTYLWALVQAHKDMRELLRCGSGIMGRLPR